jgi:hypothetical protein
MSYDRVDQINLPNKYLVPFVGDNYPKDSIQDQISNIKKSQQINISNNIKNVTIPNFDPSNIYNPTYKKNQTTNNPTEQNISTFNSDRYDPYVDFLLARGLINSENSIRYETTAINIDSTFRQIDPIVRINKTHNLLLNPLTINGNLLTIYDPNHNYNTNDRIMLSGVQNPEIIIRCGGSFNNIIFIPNTSIMIINYNYENYGVPINLPTDSSGNIDVNYVLNIDNYIQTIPTLTLNINGFVGNSPGVGTYYDSVPINSINITHNVTLIKDLNNNIYPLINLKYTYNQVYTLMPITLMTPFNVTIIFYYIYGIPINIINAGYPTTQNNIIEYYTITSTSQNTYSFILNYTAPSNYTNIQPFGGNSIYVSQINDIIEGFSDPNYYIINLDKIYRNVYMIRMISSEFPNSENPIKSNNNKIYWQNEEDGDYVYSITITPGKYNPSDLIFAMETLFYNTQRINYQQDIQNTSVPIYTNHNYIKVDINTNSDIVTFKSFREAFFIAPFIDVHPSIPLDYTLDTIPYVGYILTIKHPNHYLNVGQSILISGAISYMGIPTNTLNTQHMVYSIIDTNTYQIKLSAFNLDSQRINNGGGASVGIYVPNNIKLRFDYQDTLGNILGFRNSGVYNSITPYNYIITNNDLYANELSYNNVGQIVQLSNNALQLAGNSYIIVKCTQLSTITSVGPVKDIFAKILLSGLPGNVLYNTYLCVPKVFYEPIPELSSLEFTFYSPNGSLFDFNGVDHSFTLEITTITNILNNTHLTERSIKTLN